MILNIAIDIPNTADVDDLAAAVDLAVPDLLDENDEVIPETPKEKAQRELKKLGITWLRRKLDIYYKQQDARPEPVIQ